MWLLLRSQATTLKFWKLTRLNLQEFRCRSAQDHFALLGTQVKFLDIFNRAVIAYGETVITAHHDSVDAYLGYNVFHQRFGVRNRVIQEAVEIGAGCSSRSQASFS